MPTGSRRIVYTGANAAGSSRPSTGSAPSACRRPASPRRRPSRRCPRTRRQSKPSVPTYRRRSSRPSYESSTSSSGPSRRGCCAAPSLREGDRCDSSMRKRLAHISASLKTRDRKDVARALKDETLAQLELALDRVAPKFARGGSADVHKAWCDGEEVCLKKISLVGLTAPAREKLLRQFKTELAIMCRLHSPRTVQVLGVVSTDASFLGLVLEYMPGGICAPPRSGRRPGGRRPADLGRRYLARHAIPVLARRRTPGPQVRELLADGGRQGEGCGLFLPSFSLRGAADADDLNYRNEPQRHAGLHGARNVGRANVHGDVGRVLPFGAIVLWEISSRRSPWATDPPAIVISRVVLKRATAARAEDAHGSARADVPLLGPQTRRPPTFSEIATLLGETTPRSPSAPFAAAPGLDRETPSGQGPTSTRSGAASSTSSGDLLVAGRTAAAPRGRF